MTMAEEMAQQIDRLLRSLGAVPYVERGSRQPAQPGYAV
jgi:hypothetical protein